jgi:hypothetical protein
MVDVKERTWCADEAARIEVLRRWDESCTTGAPLRAAEIARQMPGLKTRWTQAVIAAERKARRATAKADEKRTPAIKPDAPMLQMVEEPGKPKQARAESARAKAEPEPRSAARTGGRGVAVSRGAFALGLAVSIAANIGHVLIVVRPEETIVRYASMGMAALWPLLLAVAVEVVSRVAWPHSWRWWVPGYVGTIVVGLIAFTISYQHLHGLLLAFGESALTAIIGPLGLDLTIVVAGVALLAIGETRRAEVEASTA